MLMRQNTLKSIVAALLTLFFAIITNFNNNKNYYFCTPTTPPDLSQRNDANFDSPCIFMALANNFGN